MFNHVKDWLRRWLFQSERLEYEARLLALKQMKESASIVALAREQLKGYDPRSITLLTAKNAGSLTIYDGLSPEEEVELINKIHALYTNPALKVITDFLTRQQVLYGQMEADSLLALNFSRATINGFALLWDQINEVEGRHAALRQAPETYDQFNIT